MTCNALPELEEDDQPLLEALGELGYGAVPAVWDDPAVHWSDFAAVVLRSPIDYVVRLAEFLAWAAIVQRLHNPLPMLRWNTEKTYLRDLHARGLNVVPTRWLAPGDRLCKAAATDVVVKPSVGVGGGGVARYGPHEHADAERHVGRLHREGHLVLVQPYLASVEDLGEPSLVYIEGAYSHAVCRKGFVPEGGAVAHEPSEQQRRLADRVVGDVADRFGAPLYARVDLLETPVGPVVNEVEVTDPILHLRAASGAAMRLARAVAERITSP